MNTLQLNYKVEIPPLNPWNSSMGRNSSPVGNHCYRHKTTLKSTSISVCFRGISRVPSAFVFLRWFKFAHISIQVCTCHDGC